MRESFDCTSRHFRTVAAIEGVMVGAMMAAKPRLVVVAMVALWISAAVGSTSATGGLG